MVGFGSLFVLAVISLEVDLELNAMTDSSIRLVPASEGMTIWPPRHVISSDDAERIAVSLERHFSFPEGPI